MMSQFFKRSRLGRFRQRLRPMIKVSGQQDSRFQANYHQVLSYRSRYQVTDKLYCSTILVPTSPTTSRNEMHFPGGLALDLPLTNGHLCVLELCTRSCKQTDTNDKRLVAVINVMQPAYCHLVAQPVGPQIPRSSLPSSCMPTTPRSQRS